MPIDPDERALRTRAKVEIRKRSRGVRNAIPKEAIALRSAKIVERLGALEAVANAAHIALFFPILAKNEVDLRALDARFRAENKAIYYPAIPELGPEATEPPRMTFRRVAHLESMLERGLGFLDPGPDAPEAERLDVIIVPGLAFDGNGNRLGYGAGYYDRALPRFRPPAIAIGVAFAFQLAPDLPATENDVPVDVIVTDDRVIAIG
jgi:5-formyltetrahydrofolate cyclo-ligase